MSNVHATSVTKALFAVDRRRFEFLGIVYPPGPFAAASFYPRTITLSVLGALVAGATLWAQWRHLDGCAIPTRFRTLAMAAVFLTPGLTYLATQSFGDMAALALILWAWALLQRFVIDERTSTGFAAGLILGAAFYMSLIALVYAILLALLSPVYRTLRPHAPEESAEAAARAWAAIFPTVIAFSSWAYLNWLFTGNALGFLRDRAAPIRSAVLADVAADTSPVHALVTALGDLGAAPLYVAVGALIAWVRPHVLPAYLGPVILVGVLRALGFAYPEPFAIATLLMVALASLRWIRDGRVVRGVIAAAALLQIVVGTAAGISDPEMRTWQRITTSGQTRPSDRWEVAIARELRDLPARSMLADDRSAYRIIARTGTAHPFILPADAAFEAAVSSPGRYAPYVLVALGGIAAGDELTRHYANRAPPGFTLDAAWPGWQLYRRAGAEPLLAGAGVFRFDD